MSKLNEKPFWDSYPEYFPDEWKQELYSYLIMGLPPGGFHGAIIANNLHDAVNKSHPSNTWSAIIYFCKWLNSFAPKESFGSYEKVESWLKLTKIERRLILERHTLLISDEQVMWDILKTEEHI
jgi:hypothetical protein